MDEEQHYERFDVDNDYEDAEFIDGELFYGKKREKRKWSKEDATYGVFLDSGSDSDDGRRRRGGKKKEDLTKPVGFVSSGTIDPSLNSEKGQETRAGLGSAPSGSGARAGLGMGAPPGLGFAPAKSAAADAPREDEEEEELLPTAFGKRVKEAAEKRREAESRQKEDKASSRLTGHEKLSLAAGVKIGEFEKHTKGIGAKLLAKMGFQGRLGKNADGIAVPISTKMRPRNMGMGYNDFAEREAGLPAAPGHEDEEDLRRRRAAEEAAGAPGLGAALGKKDGSGGQKLWKKKHGGAKKVVYKTAEEVLAQMEERAGAGGQQPERLKILDMRGPQVRLLTSLEGVGGAAPGAAVMADDTPMPELQHNLRLAVDLAEADIAALDRKIRLEKDTGAALEAEIGHLRGEAAGHDAALERLRTVAALIEPCMPRERDDLDMWAPGGGRPGGGQWNSTSHSNHLGKGGMALDQLASVFSKLHTGYGEEYALYNLAALALSLAMPLLAREFQSTPWDPLREPDRGLATLAGWKRLLQRASGPKDYAIFNDPEADTDPYSRLVAAAVLPALRVAVCNVWDPRDPEPLVRFLEAWEGEGAAVGAGRGNLLPASVKEYVLDHLVFPKLRAAVDAWDPRRETVAIHAWLHPWLPYLGAKLEPLYDPIRIKLIHALHEWHPSDDSALALLAPWKPVFDPASWEQLLVRSILPKLIFCLQSELVINPGNQQLGPFQWVMAWAGAIPSHHMVTLLETSFFPAWLGVLAHWLAQPGANFDEITRWYLGWKSLLAPDLQAHERVRQHLTAALDMMNAAIAGVAIPTPPAPAMMGAMPPGGYYMGHGSHHPGMGFMDGAMPMPVPPTQPPMPVNDAHVSGGESLRELLEQFAGANDVLLMPKPGRSYQGLQVYSFGDVSVVVDTPNQLLRAQVGDSWQPVSMGALLEMQQARARGVR
eukprot:jgi/Mesvir1/12902/Mv05927-RA.1